MAGRTLATDPQTVAEVRAANAEIRRLLGEVGPALKAGYFLDAMTAYYEIHQIAERIHQALYMRSVRIGNLAWAESQATEDE